MQRDFLQRVSVVEKEAYVKAGRLEKDGNRPEIHTYHCGVFILTAPTGIPRTFNVGQHGDVFTVMCTLSSFLQPSDLLPLQEPCGQHQ